MTGSSKVRRDYYDVVVIGSGPAGQKAAVRAARFGRSVLIIEQESAIGGACVHRGTIPSKTLRETAVSLAGFQRRTGDVFRLQISEDLQVASLMSRLGTVVREHERYQSNQLAKAGVEWIHGRARFVSSRQVEVVQIGEAPVLIEGGFVVIATGSEPRSPDNVPIDHEHILDSDSILSMIYLPRSLTVLGGGVIACEYASIFSHLGVAVTIIESHESPLGFLDRELTQCFVDAFKERGGTFLGNRKIESVAWDGVQSVVCKLDGGEEVVSEKLLCCLGRVANLRGLHIEDAGLGVNGRGVLAVDENYRTEIPHIYAVGDVIGPPSLASTSMHQGRQAMNHALNIGDQDGSDVLPMGIYTIPEISSVGMTEEQARKQSGDEIIVGRASFSEVARGQIAAIPDGLLKIVASSSGRLLGIHIVGEGASDLVHIGQLGLITNQSIDVFLNNTFNFPTLAEAYRVAALDIESQQIARARVDHVTAG